MIKYLRLGGDLGNELNKRDQDKSFPKTLFSLPPGLKFTLFPIYS